MGVTFNVWRRFRFDPSIIWGFWLGIIFLLDAWRFGFKLYLLCLEFEGGEFLLKLLQFLYKLSTYVLSFNKFHSNLYLPVLCVLSFLHHKLEFLLVVLLQLFVCLDIALEHVVSVDCQFLDLAFLGFRLFLGLLRLRNYLQGSASPGCFILSPIACHLEDVRKDVAFAYPTSPIAVLFQLVS